MKQKLIHYAEVFGVAFGLTLLVNAQHVMDAHGLGALKSAGMAALITAGKAGIEALRKALAPAAQPPAAPKA